MQAKEYSLKDIASLVGGEITGSRNLQIKGIAAPQRAKEDEIALIDTSSYMKDYQKSRAGAFLVHKKFTGVDRPCVKVDKARLAFAKILALFADSIEHRPGIDKTAQIAEGVCIKGNCSIQEFVCIETGSNIQKNTTLLPGVHIGRDVSIGSGCVIYDNVVIGDGVKIGDRVIIQANTVVGSDGFGYVWDKGAYMKVPHLGSVEIGDRVEIGVSVTIDRGTLDNTVIGRGTKVGNLTQIAHNVKIGENVLMIGMTGIAGSCIIGDGVVMAGQASITDHVEVGPNAVIAARSLVTKAVQPGAFVSGEPACLHRRNMKILASSRRLPDLVKEMQILRKKVLHLENLLISDNQTNQ